VRGGRRKSNRSVRLTGPGRGAGLISLVGDRGNVCIEFGDNFDVRRFQMISVLGNSISSKRSFFTPDKFVRFFVVIVFEPYDSVE
jgi:hypothetical protein